MTRRSLTLGLAFLLIGGLACIDDDIPPRPPTDAGPSDDGGTADGGDDGNAGDDGGGADGGVVLLASASPCEGMKLVVSAGTLYWTEEATGKVKSVPTSGGRATTIASAQVRPGALAVDGTSIYWVAGDKDQAIMKRSLAGGSTSVFVPASNLPDPLGGENAVNALLAADGWLYFGRYIYTYKIQTDGDTPIPIGRSPESDLGKPGAYALGDAYLYQVEISHNAVTRERIDGMQMGLLAEGSAITQPLAPDRIAVSQGELVTDAIAVVDDHVAWADGPSLWRKPGNALEGDAPTLVTTSIGDNAITGFVVSADTVYFGEYSDNTVQTAAFYDGTPRVIATGQSAPGQFAADDANVYWRTSDCRIMKLAK